MTAIYESMQRKPSLTGTPLSITIFFIWLLSYRYLQSTKWSFTIPIDCRKEYVMTEPTKLMPRFFMSLLRRIEILDSTGISESSFQCLSICCPSVKPQRYASKEPNSFCIFCTTSAFLQTLKILFRFRMRPVSDIKAVSSSSVITAQASILKL